MMTFHWLGYPARLAALAVILATTPMGLAQPELADSESADPSFASPLPPAVVIASPNAAATDAGASAGPRLAISELGADEVNNSSSAPLDAAPPDAATASVGGPDNAADQVSTPGLNAGAAPAPAMLASSTTATTAPCAANSRAEDEVWLVSSRGSGCQPFGADGPRLQYWRYAQQNGWVASSGDAFFATARAEQPIMIAAHGNRINHQEASRFGWSVYQQVVRCAADQPPLRFVIWSWPSDKVPGKPADDVRIKCARADVDSRFVAWFIGRLPATEPLSLCGYSLGARIVGGALELTAGGTVNGRPLETSAGPPRSPARAVFVAAAIDNDWLLPGRRYGHALGQLEHMTSLYNSTDRALRFYHRIYSRHGGPEALGYTGLASPQLLGAERAKVEQRDVACAVGPRHDWERYVPAFGGLIARGLAYPVVTPAVRAAKTSKAPATVATGAATADAVAADAASNDRAAGEGAPKAASFALENQR